MGDKLDLSAFGVADFSDLAEFIHQDGDDTIIEFYYFGNIERITLQGFAQTSLSASSFVFNTSTAGLTTTGTGGADVLFGGRANDTLSGGTGNDRIIGGQGNDRINGGVNNDVLTGGAGNDIFDYSARDFDLDVITDFTAGDRIDLSALGVGDFADLAEFFYDDGDNGVIEFYYFGNIERITLTGFNTGSLSASSFIFNTSTAGLTTTGTGGADVLFGGGANDTLSGGTGNDRIIGGQGADRINGGVNNDVLTGGAGNDIFDYTARDFDLDVITDFTAGDRIDLTDLNVGDFSDLAEFIRQEGDDTILEFYYFGNVERITLQGVAATSLSASSFVLNASTAGVTVSGTGGADVLFGGRANDTLSGGTGNDRIIGGQGNDRINGGVNNDTLTGGAGNDIFDYTGRDFDLDIITDFTAGDRIDLSDLNVGDFASIQHFIRQEGADTIIELGYFGNIERITLQGVNAASLSASSFIFNARTTALTVAGTGGADVLFGGNANDTISGGSGNDTLVGGLGADRMTGGTGNDIYYVDNLGDLVFEVAGGGTDTVRTTVNFGAAGQDIENLTAIGSARVNIVGNELNNTLIGNDNVNALNGSKGADIMIGGGGNDLYYVDNTGDIVTELAGGGTDTIRASITYTLGDHQERLQLVGSQQVNAIGNALDNVLQGNARSNVIIGMGGRDLMTGGAGADRFDFRYVTDSPFAAYDRITDLEDEDVINLSSIDANTNVAGNQAFVLVDAFTGHAGQLTMTWNATGQFTVLAADVDGDGVGDFRVILDGDHRDYDNFRL